MPLEDDRLIEVSWSGDIVWEWVASDHIDELGFSPDARKAIKAASAVNAARGSFDWLHVNSATYVGPNRWFDQGDRRFAPNNVIISSREASLLAIVGRDGSIVWRLGPDFTESKELRAIRQIIGQHHAHFIPKGLPGAGNLLVFDNGGASGYGFTNPIAPDGRGAFVRPTSRVLEINPVTLELVWSYTNPRFFSTNISSAQRLPNGNTLSPPGPGDGCSKSRERARSSGNTCIRCSAAPTRRTPCIAPTASHTAGFRSSRGPESSASLHLPSGTSECHDGSDDRVRTARALAS